MAPEIMRESQRGSPRENLTARWLVTLKTYGIRPIKFKRISKRNKLETTLMNPPSLMPKDRVSWAVIIDFGVLIRKLHRVGAIQNLILKRAIIVRVQSHIRR